MKAVIACGWNRFQSFCRRRLAVMVFLLGLALGITANTAVSLAWTVLMNALQGPHPDRLLMVSERLPTGGNSPVIYSPADFEELRRRNVSFAAVAAYDQKFSVLGGPECSRSLLITCVSAGFFKLLDTRPELGRFFVSEEDQPQGEPVVVLSNHLWKE